MMLERYARVVGLALLPSPLILLFGCTAAGHRQGMIPAAGPAVPVVVAAVGPADLAAATAAEPVEPVAATTAASLNLDDLSSALTQERERNAELERQLEERGHEIEALRAQVQE